MERRSHTMLDIHGQDTPRKFGRTATKLVGNAIRFFFFHRRGYGRMKRPSNLWNGDRTQCWAFTVRPLHANSVAPHLNPSSVRNSDENRYGTVGKLDFHLRSLFI
ncbi:hypothetical protein AVEN_25853-1 [Araneus ventricosus]|uniref:Uncharacterized protein n=1 Tax=Araneus ventricosus TaxID=182803 RepID=A0A4Y2MDV5_ARAVE|nr:hypothetical protein AVEN_25853-1 [Araneus ventricosus]